MIDKHIIDAAIMMLEDELADPSTDCKITMHRIHECINLLHLIRNKA